jgi:protein-S-isoprenylcysteine O-methyltransferase Ste14
MGKPGDPCRALPDRSAFGDVAPHQTRAGCHVTAAIAAYAAICLAMVFVELALARRGSADAAPAAKFSDQIMVFGTTAALIIGLVSAALRMGAVAPRGGTLVVGVVLGLAGVALRGFAMSTLGRYYSLTPQVETDQAIVTRGPYRLIRHPGYAGILLSILGLQLVAGTWVALLATLFVIVPLPLRIRLEEHMLLEQRGTRYEDYERRTRYRLIPGIY